MEEGKYIYCIIGTDEERNFGPIGIGGRGDEVVTIPYRDLSAVISNSPMTKYIISKENLTAHEIVIEKVMRDYTVLPVRFCTIALNAEEIRGLLKNRYIEFKHLLRDMDNKIELGVKALWRDMDLIFQEITNENEEIKRLKERILKSPRQAYYDKIAIGEIVQSALEAKKNKEGEEILSVLRKISIDYRTNMTYGDRMLLNAAFLVDKGREKEFDSRMDELATKHEGRIKFSYVGPAPPYNFVNITIHLEG